MSKFRILIADDERPAREFLKVLLREFDDVELAGEASNGTEALELIESAKPALALLDLQMPELSGLELVKRLTKTQLPLVAFVTAFDQYAVQAFELNAIDYLLKPVEKDRLRRTIDRARDRLKNDDWRRRENNQLQAAAQTYDTISRARYIERIPVKKRDDIILLQVAEIVSIVAEAELLHITTKDNQRYVINFRLKELEARLDPGLFVRLSRGALVNVGMISLVSPLPGGTYLVALENGQEITTSRQQSRILKAQLLKL